MDLLLLQLKLFTESFLDLDKIYSNSSWNADWLRSSLTRSSGIFPWNLNIHCKTLSSTITCYNEVIVEAM